MTESPLPASTVAGFRLVRRLGDGTRADVYLGVSPSGFSAAIKVYHPDVGRKSIAQELSALGRISSAHCVQLLDVAEDDVGTPVAVLSKVTAGSVASVLSDRGTIGMGEAVTILAPVAGLLCELHASGVAHGGISAATVHFSDAGAPVLLGFGHTDLFAPNAAPAVLETLDAVRADRERLALLAGFVIDRVDRRDDAQTLRRWLDALPRPLASGFADEFAQRLFDRCGATAVTVPTFGGQKRDADSGWISPNLGDGAGATTGARPARRHQTRAHTVSRDWVAAALGARPLRGMRERLVAGLRGVRRPVWIVAGLVVVGLAAVTPLVASSGLDGATSAPPVTTREGDRGADDSADPAAGVIPPALPDDPVEALPLLLAERTRCIEDLSVLCLDAVNQSGSSALADDRALIEAVIAGTAGEYPNVVGASPLLVERLGDSALVTVGEQNNPASVLMIKTEAGWRVREIRAP